MRSVLRQLLTLLALVASIGAASVTVVHADPVFTTSGGGLVGVRLLDPSPGVGFESQNYIFDNVQPGAAIKRRVEVSNDIDKPRTIEVYTGAAAKRGDQYTVQDRGTTNRLTGWTSVDKQTLTLARGATAVVTVTITVPADAPVGTQYGVVWVQAAADGSGLSTGSRVGVRVYPTVVPPSGQTADFTISGLTAERDSAGRAVVVADVRNTGSWALDLDGELTLVGPEGLTVGPVYPDAATIARGATGKVRFVIANSADLPSGPWQASVKLRSGPIEHAHSGTVDFPAAGTGTGSLGSLGSLGGLGSLGS
ncbi:hypothetical protein ABI214_13515 [Prescottella soli]|uniref:DUF916 domain-containing protein n=1 Tax=Prescottella soli TaxID=1543852 RepID=A0ABW9FXY2_9NOCA